MAEYRVDIQPTALRDIDWIARKQDRRRVVARIQRLAEDPRPPGCRKLTATSLYRVRQGSFRIVYEIRDDILIVLVIRVGNRRDVYRMLRR